MATIRTLRDATITLIDGSGTPKTLALTFDGSLYFRITRQNVAISHRGTLDRWVDGGEATCEVRFEGAYEYLSWYDPDGETLYDALNGVESADDWATTATKGDVYCLTLRVDMADPTGNVEPERLTFSQFVMDSIEFVEDEAGNRLFVTGRALVAAPTVTWP